MASHMDLAALEVLGKDKLIALLLASATKGLVEAKTEPRAAADESESSAASQVPICPKAEPRAAADESESSAAPPADTLVDDSQVQDSQAAAPLADSLVDDSQVQDSQADTLVDDSQVQDSQPRGDERDDEDLFSLFLRTRSQEAPPSYNDLFPGTLPLSPIGSYIATPEPVADDPVTIAATDALETMDYADGCDATPARDAPAGQMAATDLITRSSLAATASSTCESPAKQSSQGSPGGINDDNLLAFFADMTETAPDVPVATDAAALQNDGYCANGVYQVEDDTMYEFEDQDEDDIPVSQFEDFQRELDEWLELDALSLAPEPTEAPLELDDADAVLAAVASAVAAECDLNDADNAECTDGTEGDVAGSEKPLTRREIEVKHSRILASSYSNKNAYMRFARQSKSRKKPLDPKLMERFLKDKQSLFLDYLESGEDWLTVTALEVRRQLHSKVARTKYALRTRGFLIERYNGNVEMVDSICAAKRRAGLCSPDPDCPEHRENDLYYVRDEVSVEDINLSSHETILQGTARVSKDGAKALFENDKFKDSAVPIRAAVPAGLWGQMDSTQPVVVPVILDEDVAVASEASSSNGGTAAQTSTATVLAALGLNADQQQALSAVLAGAAGTQAGKGKGKSKKRKSEAGQGHGQKAKPSKPSKAPQSELDKGKALQRSCLDAAAECRSALKRLQDICGSQSLVNLLLAHESAWDTLFHDCSKLVKDDDSEADSWGPLQERALQNKDDSKSTLTMVNDIMTGIAKRAKKTPKA
jgi:hypothetical protein